MEPTKPPTSIFETPQPPVEGDFLATPEEPKQSIGSHILEFFQTLVVFAAIAAAIYLFIAQPHRVSGLSMFPNFHNGDYIITDKLTYKLGEPKRGDIVVFKNPRNEGEDFIKRIMGLPQDKVEVRNGHIYINGSLLNEPYLKPDIITTPGSYLQEGQPKTVSEGHFLVMGDNRGNSSDSREWGEITKAEIIGKVFVRYWPQDSIGLYPAAYSFEKKNN